MNDIILIYLVYDESIRSPSQAPGHDLNGKNDH